MLCPSFAGSKAGIQSEHLSGCPPNSIAGMTENSPIATLNNEKKIKKVLDRGFWQILKIRLTGSA